MSISSSNLPKEDLEQCVCGFCKCFTNVTPIRLIEGKITCGRCPGEGIKLPIIETLAKNIVFPCRYSKYGCQRTLKWNEASEHEGTCNYKEIKCTVLDCEWSGAKCNLLDHFTKSHGSLLIGPRRKINIRPEDTKVLNALYVDGDKIFTVTIATGPKGIVHCVRAFCRNSELTSYYYNISMNQDTIDLQWGKQKLLSFDDSVYSTNKTIPITCLQFTFKMANIVQVEIAVKKPVNPGSENPFTLFCGSCEVVLGNNIYVKSCGHSCCSACVQLKKICCNQSSGVYYRNLALEGLLLQLNSLQ